MAEHPTRDETAARAFAVKWSTKSRGDIANLAGCYLRASATLEALRRALREEGAENCECAACRWAFHGVVTGMGGDDG